MSQHIPDSGCRFLLDLITDGLGSAPLVHLFRADHTPAAGDTPESYVEADYSGYAPQALTTWTAAQTVGGVTTAIGDQLTFTVGPGGVGNDVYGYYVTDATDTVLLWAERDPAAPVEMQTEGQEYILTPRLRLASSGS